MIDTPSRPSPRGRQADGSPHPVDIYVGNRVRLRRMLLGLSQESLASRLGITFQQLQKYERGLNRISSSRLYDISKLLQVDIDYFFDGLENPNVSLSTPDNAPATNWFHQEETLILVNAYNKIKNPKLRRHLYNLIIGMSGIEHADDN